MTSSGRPRRELPPLGALLDLLHRSVLPLGTRERLACARIVRSLSDLDPSARVCAPGELSSALASLLARSDVEWRAIHALAEDWRMGDARHLGVRARDARRASGEAPHRAGAPFGADTLKGIATRASAFGGLLKRRPWSAAGSVALAIAALTGVGMALREPPPWMRSASTPLSVAADAPNADARTLDAFESVVVEVPARAPSSAPELRPSRSADASAELGDRVAAFVVSCILVGALSLLRKRARRLQWTRRRAARKRQATIRERLEEARARSGVQLQVSYHVPKHVALDAAAIADTAGLLSGGRDPVPIDVLDEEASLRATVEAAGWFTPIFQKRLETPDTCVWVDVERGCHPWLGPFERLLRAWESLGVDLRRAHFSFVPEVLTDPRTGVTVEVASLARQAAGQRLVVFSRALSLETKPGALGRAGRAEAAWVARCEAWAQRAWIDPDPRSELELPPAKRRAIDELRARGWCRFPLDRTGIESLARALAGRPYTPRPRASSLPALPPRDAPAEHPIAEALRCWAFAASLVPDPTWEQLETLRARIPIVRRALPDPRSLQRLLEWVERETGCGAESASGMGLHLPAGVPDRWLRVQRARAAVDARVADLETCVRRMLLEQLAPTRPSDELALAWWNLKRAQHLAFLDPRLGAELLAAALDSPVGPEASRWVQGELARYDAGLGASFSPREVAALRRASAPAQLDSSMSPGWMRRFVVPVAAAAGVSWIVWNTGAWSGVSARLPGSVRSWGDGSRSATASTSARDASEPSADPAPADPAPPGPAPADRAPDEAAVASLQDASDDVVAPPVDVGAMASATREATREPPARVRVRIAIPVAKPRRPGRPGGTESLGASYPVDGSAAVTAESRAEVGEAASSIAESSPQPGAGAPSQEAEASDREPEAAPPSEQVLDLYLRSRRAASESDYELAASLSERAMQLAAERAPTSERVGVLALNTGTLYAQIEAWEKAQPALERALAAYEQQFGDSAAELLSPLEQLARAYAATGDARGELDALERRLAIASAASGERASATADAAIDLARALATHAPRAKLARDTSSVRTPRGSRKEMLVEAARVVDLARAAFLESDDSVGVGEAWLLSSVIAEARGRRNTALREQRTGFEILEDALPEGDPRLAQLCRSSLALREDLLRPADRRAASTLLAGGGGRILQGLLSRLIRYEQAEQGR